MLRTLPIRRLASHRGVAALTVVMVLFFVMALVAAYTNRNLVFEQRVSANSYRATRALEAADAGVEWTLAMLNGGRTTANCTVPSGIAAPGLTDFRSRYLVPSTDESNGEGAFELPWTTVPANIRYPACIIVNGAPRCICPAAGAVPANINPPGDGIGSAFRITFRLFHSGIVVRGGAVQFVSRGCSSPGDGATSCFAQNDDLPQTDGATAVIATVGLVRALPVAPKAALTAGTTISAVAPGRLEVSNGDFTSGWTAHAGGVIDAPGSRFVGPAGSGADGQIGGDTVLLAKSVEGAEPWFRALFVLDTATYERQPAVVRLNCAAGCTRTNIADALLLNPRNPIWADGNVNIDAAGELGTAADPMMLIVTGNLTISGNAVMRGFVHATDISWTAAAATLDGAAVARTTFNATGVATVRYDKAALDTIRLRYGSFVRVPGGWNLL
ncbi:MAG: PilX N-terminal domain-containing pilus assembly protein [Aquabacterium sp.]|nr:PilX N-terminal domain-containing pilus assembly protein [Aquabacterium sp.]